MLTSITFTRIQMPRPTISPKPMMGKKLTVKMTVNPMVKTMRTPIVRKSMMISRPKLTLGAPLVRTLPQALALLAPEHLSCKFVKSPECRV